MWPERLINSRVKKLESIKHSCSFIDTYATKNKTFRRRMISKTFFISMFLTGRQFESPFWSQTRGSSSSAFAFSRLIFDHTGKLFLTLYKTMNSTTKKTSILSIWFQLRHWSFTKHSNKKSSKKLTESSNPTQIEKFQYKFFKAQKCFWKALRKLSQIEADFPISLVNKKPLLPNHQCTYLLALWFMFSLRYIKYWKF